MTQLHKLYQACVTDAVRSNLLRAPDTNPSAATELAFQACKTEEQAILADAEAAGVTSAQANQVIVGFKLNLKQTIRDRLAEARRQVLEERAQPAAALPPQTSKCGFRRYDGAWVMTPCN